VNKKPKIKKRSAAEDRYQILESLKQRSAIRDDQYLGIEAGFILAPEQMGQWGLNVEHFSKPASISGKGTSANRPIDQSTSTSSGEFCKAGAGAVKRVFRRRTSKGAVL